MPVPSLIPRLRLTRNLLRYTGKRNMQQMQINHNVTEPEYTKDMKRWKWFSLCAVPVFCWVIYDIFIAHEHDYPPPFVPYKHLRIHERDFWWGDGMHTPFHGDNNPLPSGWEEGNPHKELQENGFLQKYLDDNSEKSRLAQEKKKQRK